MTLQKWKKLGRIFNPEDHPGNTGAGYAAVPVVAGIEENELIIYFTYRDQHNRSLPSWVKMSILPDIKITGIGQEPLLSPGYPGFFDEDGVMPTSTIIIDNKQYLYYIGWNKAVSVPFRNAIGVAVSDKGKHKFTRMFDGPILDRSIYDPCFVASNCVIRDDGQYKMYYLSCNKWTRKDNKLVHSYDIKYAESSDGINWQRNGKTAISFAYENEYAISVPRVIKEKGIYKAWYSYRGGPKGDTYRIGYAESEDGLKFIRKDHLVDLDISQDGWDSEMICYPEIFDMQGKRYMLYNGNGYGKSGFGLAVLES
jgi:hypothetical protein